MTTITTRTVHLSVKVPTLEDVIRGVISPVYGSGDSATFTIPEWVEIGDLLIYFVGIHQNMDWESNSEYMSFSLDDANWLKSLEVSCNAAEFDGGVAAVGDGNRPGLTLYSGSRIADEGDIGTSVTVSFKQIHTPPPPIPAAFAEPVLFLLVIRNDHYHTDNAYMSNWQVGYYEGSPDQPPPALTECYRYIANEFTVIDEAFDVVFFTRATYEGGGRGILPIGVTELCDAENTVGLYVGAKIIANGVEVNYRTESDISNINAMIGIGVH
jgi:hypothetical protein